MVKVIQVADDGTETAAIEVDDFTIEVIYSGLAEMLREAAESGTVPQNVASCDLSREARQRREKILTRIRG
jgi:hypothetical protein